MIMYGCRLVHAPKKRTACGWCTCGVSQKLVLYEEHRADAVGDCEVARQNC